MGGESRLQRVEGTLWSAKGPELSSESLSWKSWAQWVCARERVVLKSLLLFVFFPS